jgi:hypothetical protein
VEFLGIIFRVLLILEVSIYFCVYALYITNQFCSGGGGGGGVKSVCKVTVNSKEENSLDFCRNYVQEFGLWSYFDYCINLPTYDIIQYFALDSEPDLYWE